MSATYRTERGRKVPEAEAEARSALLTREHQRRVRRERHAVKLELRIDRWSR